MRAWPARVAPLVLCDPFRTLSLQGSTHAAGEAPFLIAARLIKRIVLSDKLATNLGDRVFEWAEKSSALFGRDAHRS